MTSDSRTTDEIERDIDNERAEMSETLRNLQEKFSVDTIFNDIGDMVHDQGGEFGRRVSHAVGRNPAAVAIVGVGLAWLFLGKDRTQSPNREHGLSGPSSGRQGEWAGAARRDRRASSHDGHVPEGDPAWYGKAYVSTDRRSNGVDAGRDGRGPVQGDASGGMMAQAGNAAKSAGHAISDATDTWRETASGLTARLSDGLEDLSEEARSRVMSARRAAHEARLSSQAMMNKGMHRTSDFFEDQPLVVGALAVAVGAAFGAVLSHTSFEDNAMGESRDRLFAEAEAVFRDERDKAMAAARKVGKTVASEVRDDVRDMGSTLGDLLPEGQSASDTVVEHASDAAGRIMDSATGKSGQRGPIRSDT